MEPRLPVALALIGITEEKRLKNLTDFLVERKVDLDIARKPNNILIEVGCTLCSDTGSYRELSDIPMEDVRCSCGSAWMVKCFDTEEDSNKYHRAGIIAKVCGEEQ